MSVYSWVLLRRADRHARRRVAALLEIFEVAVRVAGLAFGRRTEQRGDVGIALDVGLAGEIEIAAVCLRLAGESVLQMLFGLAVLQLQSGLLRVGKVSHRADTGGAVSTLESPMARVYLESI
jgi:hypothetical protein